MVEIKRLNTASISQIMAFDKLCFPADHWNENDWKDLLEDHRAIYYALLDGGNIIGDVFIYNWQGEKDYIKIMNLAIRAEHRGQGYAHALLKHVTMEMEKLGMRRFCGETRASNQAMQRVFEACGYTLSAIVADYYDNPSESAYKYVLQI